MKVNDSISRDKFDEKINEVVVKISKEIVELSDKVELPWTALTAVTVIVHRRMINAQFAILKDDPKAKEAFRTMQIKVAATFLEELKVTKW